MLIKSQKDFDLFSIKYGVIEDGIFPHLMIKWKKVSKHYGGIEVRDVKKLKYVSNKLIKYFNTSGDMIPWVNLFDIDSGCVWNPKVITKIEYLNDKLKEIKRK